MKQLFAFVICTILPLCAISQKYVDIPKNSATEEFDQLIEELDVIKLLDTTRRGDAAYFWETVINNNDDLSKYYNALQKNKANARKAVDEIDELPYLRYVLKDRTIRNYTDEFKNIVCGENSPYDVNVFIYWDQYANAYSDPRGDIGISTGLIDLFENNSINKQIAICAHEMCHFLLQHAAVSIWKENRSFTVAAIVGATVAAAEVAVAIYAAKEGSHYTTAGEATRDFGKAITAAVEIYKYKYARKQELEADLIAVRLLEWVNIDPWSYVEALNDLKIIGDASGGYTSDHPRTKYRIAFLTHLIENYKLMNVEEIANELRISDEGWLRMTALNKCLSELGFPSEYHIGAAYFRELDRKWDLLWQKHLENMLRGYMRAEDPETIEIKLTHLKDAYDLMLYDE